MIPSIRTGLAWTLLSRYINMALQFGSVVVLARLLSPEEIGIYSIAVAMFTLGQVIREFGIGEFIVQERNLTREKIASAFSISLISCYLLAALFYFIGPFAADFYEKPQLLVLFQYLVLNFLMIPFGTLTLSLLRREKEFKKLMIIETGSAMTYTAVAILAAYQGYGYLSLAYASLTGTATTIFLALMFRPVYQPWWPSMMEVKRVGSFGWHLSYAQLIGNLNHSAPELIIGKFLGVDWVAMFGKAMSTNTLFSQLVFQSLSRVLGPIFAEKDRMNSDLKEPFIRCSSQLIVIAWTFFGFFILRAEQLILFLYGDQWGEAVPILRIVCIASMIGITTVLTERILISKGKARRLASIQTQYFIIALSGILIGVQFSIYMVAWALVVERSFRCLILFNDMKVELAVRFSDLIPMLWHGLLVTLFSLACSALFSSFVNSGHDFYIIASALAGLATGWLIAVFALSHPIANEVILIYRSIRKLPQTNDRT